MPRYVARPLSALRVKTLNAPGLYCDGGGLYLKVNPTGSKSWIFRYQAGKRKIGLGSLDTFSLAEARERALKLRQQLNDGIDPIAERRATRTTPAVRQLTFSECVERYIAAHEAGWKNGAGDWRASLTKHVFPHFGDQPVAKVDMAMIMAALEPGWTKQPVRLGIVRGRIESVLDWAKTRGMRQGENPARWRGHLENLLPSHRRVATVKHRAAMPYAEIGGFMEKLHQLTDTSARVLELQILTAVRSGEATGARWDEIDMAERVWAIPAERMKAKKEHRVPLSDAAIAVLNQQAAMREGEFVFSSRRRADRAINIDAPMRPLHELRLPCTAHGFRSSFSDWAAERTSFPREIVEAALAHQVGTAVERAYRRTDWLQKRRQLLDAWAAFIAQPAIPASATVVAIGRQHA